MIPLRDLTDLFGALVHLTSARREVHWAKDGRLVLRRLERAGPANFVDQEGLDQMLGRAARAISRAARYAPFPTSCLVRALALEGLLRDWGVGEAQVRVGVRWDGLTFEAHAWVEYGERKLGRDGRVAARYAPLTQLTAGLGGPALPFR